ncbi:MAG: hypothetical protein FWC36_00980 [Spirochaetes bacterium]|nr:hypothetical protein [Spirochaetota bacterium]
MFSKKTWDYLLTKWGILGCAMVADKQKVAVTYGDLLFPTEAVFLTVIK